ncbi:hypothetical protein BC941DRAFT_505913 [Chlamydoabsidia padenii]|nr:hypothetical protein BC941DRAFT_505913 [Chlamydoabsidia padenii]
MRFSSGEKIPRYPPLVKDSLMFQVYHTGGDGNISHLTTTEASIKNAFELSKKLDATDAESILCGIKEAETGNTVNNYISVNDNIIGINTFILSQPQVHVQRQQGEPATPTPTASQPYGTGNEDDDDNRSIFSILLVTPRCMHKDVRHTLGNDGVTALQSN